MFVLFPVRCVLYCDVYFKPEHNVQSYPAPPLTVHYASSKPACSSRAISRAVSDFINTAQFLIRLFFHGNHRDLPSLLAF